MHTVSMQGRGADGCLAGCSWFTQFGVLLRRAMLGQLRNPTDTTSRLFLSTWVGVLAGECCAVLCCALLLLRSLTAHCFIMCCLYTRLS